MDTYEYDVIRRVIDILDEAESISLNTEVTLLIEFANHKLKAIME